VSITGRNAAYSLFPGSYIAATRVMLGAICLSSWTHSAPISYSNWANPVMLPPGSRMLATKPVATGSAICANTIGIVCVARCNAVRGTEVPANINSGFIATSSAA
jgi:hypothetical protein